MKIFTRFVQIYTIGFCLTYVLWDKIYLNIFLQLLNCASLLILAIVYYFYNNETIGLPELIQSLGNEIPHSFLFNPREEKIMGAGDFTVNDSNHIVELTGYSGHTKPNPSNVHYSALKFDKLGYMLKLVPIETITLQTNNTDRLDSTNRLLGTYVGVIFKRRDDVIDDDEEGEEGSRV